MVLAALAVILVPLLRPALKSAAGNAAPDEKPSWGLALTISIALPLAAVALYLALGQPAAFLPREHAPPQVQNQQTLANRKCVMKGKSESVIVELGDGPNN